MVVKDEHIPSSFLTGWKVEGDPVEEVRHDQAARTAVHEQDLHKVPDQLQLVHQLRLKFT